MTWNYRVFKDEHGGYSIRDTFYGNKGRVEGWASEPVYPYGDTVEELRQDLKLMLEALDHITLVEYSEE